MLIDLETHLEKVARPVVAVANEYPDGYVVPQHCHERGQLLHGSSGVVMVTTPHGAWMMPPQRGMWIPAGFVHEVRMLGAVSMRSIFLESKATEGMPNRCQVVEMSRFMRNLLAEAVRLPAEYDLEGRSGSLMALIQFEMRLLPPLPLALPLPLHDALARRCREFVSRPNSHEAIEDWSDSLAMSRRTFTRLFRRETGLSFVEWRQQACLIAALPRLANGAAVTTVAMELGYDNPAAFTTMFKRVLGASPRAYFNEQR